MALIKCSECEKENKNGNKKIKRKISLFMICGLVILSICGCNKVEEKTFQLSYEKKSNDLIIEGGSSNYTLILPTNTKFFEDKDNLKDAFKFYDYSNGETIEDITYNIDFDITKEGAYAIDIEGKYNNKIGNTKVNIQLIKSCSGKCEIKTTNWNIDLTGDYTYGNYSPNYILKVKSTFSPNESAFEFDTQTEKYESINDGYIYLYYQNYASYNKELASEYRYDDNALYPYYKLHERKENMYVQFVSIPKLEKEAFIDFYDSQAKTHNFYIIN